MARRSLALAVALISLLCVPASASAAKDQLSILQDDRVLVDSARDPEAAMAEAKLLGVDVVRAFLTWERVSPSPTSRRIPAGFDPANPARGYDWSVYDRFVASARRHGIKVMFDLSPAIPYWASEQPSKCPHFIGGYKRLGKGCYWKPRADLFGKFAAAAAKRYRGQVAYWSVWNEPNLEHYLYPQVKRTRFGTVDLAARRYRELWIAGQRAIARHDRGRRNRVLFGETAAISSPLDTLYAALCLDQRGRPFKGRMKRLQGCVKPRRLPVGGFAVHPYNRDASGSVGQRSFTKDSLTMNYMPRLHRLIRRARRLGRVGRKTGVYVTELGFQSRPPERRFGVSLTKQARLINEVERLFFADPRIRSMSQYELFDVPQPGSEDIYQTGLRFLEGAAKPALAAFRMPIVATRAGRGRVGVWGGARPATGRVRVALQARIGKRWRTVARPRTSRRGYWTATVKRTGASKLRYRAVWNGLVSRTATAGKPLRYRRD